MVSLRHPSLPPTDLGRLNDVEVSPMLAGGSSYRAFHNTGPGFKLQAEQGRLSHSSLQWVHKYLACLGTKH
ncbi:hypothetical protein TNCV_2657121 [Trichonephila clavipes]|nr:hypothetical protein TNCV_2657121 [Trichonephila clavipes]